MNDCRPQRSLAILWQAQRRLINGLPSKFRSAAGLQIWAKRAIMKGFTRTIQSTQETPMTQVIRAAPLYTFLWHCNLSALEKTVLDCGAGGPRPPLALFHACGYQTTGLEISPERLRLSARYEAEHGVQLNIRQGDMRCIPLPDGSVSFVYSFNTIFHLSRADIARAVGEMQRVLRPRGLCYVNFLSVEDGEFGLGREIEPGTFVNEEDGKATAHTYFADEEGDALFTGCELVRKEKRIVDQRFDGHLHRMAFIDYIVQKPAG